MKLFQDMIDTILPPRCVVSGDVVEGDGALSAETWASLSFINAPYCEVCGLPFEVEVKEETLCVECLENPPDYDCARSCVVYGDTSRKMILKYKHGDHVNIAHSFTPWMKVAGKDFWDNCDYIIPVPLHYWRLVGRRYNQAAVLANILSKKTDIAWLHDTLKRNRATVIQGHMDAVNRLKNVRNAFEVKGTRLQGKNVVLIDDVFTTGATVNECAKALRRAGVKRIDVLTVARVVRGSYKP